MFGYSLATAGRSVLFLAFAATLFLQAVASAQAPEVVRFQGTVDSLGGGPVQEGSYVLRAEIFDVATGGNPLFSREVSTEIVGGSYTLTITPGTPGALESALDGVPRFLQVTVVSGPGGSINETLLPRQELASTPYALAAANASQEPEPWQSAALQNGWQNYGGNWAPASFYKQADGLVRLRGLVKKNSTPANGEALFTLPEGYRPEFDRTFLLLACCGQQYAGSNVYDHAAARINVRSSGAVEWVAGRPNFIDLGSIDFRASEP